VASTDRRVERVRIRVTQEAASQFDLFASKAEAVEEERKSGEERKSEGNGRSRTTKELEVE
jgi:hypothetical protein